jgi:nitrite reductase/ring-hydroxylating ferredoxin subunit
MVMCEDDGFVSVFEDNNLKEGTFEETSVQGMPIFLIRYEKNGEVFAISSLCPHEGRYLTEINGYYICCQAHGFCFDIRTGDCKGYEDSSFKLKRFDCKIKDGKIWVKLE